MTMVRRSIPENSSFTAKSTDPCMRVGQSHTARLWHNSAHAMAPDKQVRRRRARPHARTDNHCDRTARATRTRDTHSFPQCSLPQQACLVWPFARSSQTPPPLHPFAVPLAPGPHSREVRPRERPPHAHSVAGRRRICCRREAQRETATAAQPFTRCHSSARAVEFVFQTHWCAVNMHAAGNCSSRLHGGGATPKLCTPRSYVAAEMQTVHYYAKLETMFVICTDKITRKHQFIRLTCNSKCK